jgi:glutaminyl-peptide cyclotransferase
MHNWDKKNRQLFWAISGIIIICVIIIFILLIKDPNKVFDQEAAFQNIETQMTFGPRVPGSEAHQAFIGWASAELIKNDWKVELQTGEISGHALTNIIGKKGQGDEIIMLSAHYDSRIVADQDTAFPTVSEPVPGANDGASGVAVLLELSRVLTISRDKQVWIVLFDIEDNGNLQDWEWILGSRYFADNLEIRPSVVVNLDMIGDSELTIYKEKNSTASVNDDIWGIAEQLGYKEVFIPQYAHSIIDDHTPFLRLGIEAVDIIDMDYPYWHTTEDDISRVSARSLGVVGHVIKTWLEK